MILRKPYAFLIKHFQKINLALFLLASFVIYKNLTFLGMVREYVDTKYYNPIADAMANYASFGFYIAIFALIIISSVLIYLLYYKKKPVIVYGLVIAEYLAVMVAFSFAASYFNEIGFNVINLQQAMLVRDVLFIVSIPQYAVLVILFIRFLGLDLKKFGFREDEEYIDIQESDREEFELEVGLDAQNIKRSIRQKFRYAMYFVLENKVVLLIIASVLFLIGSYFGYQALFVENRVYNEGQSFRANSYVLKMNEMYFTDKDYAGNMINPEGRKYMVVDLNIKNVSSNPIVVDTNKFVITGNRNYYAPIKTHDYYFTDLGKGYQSEELKPNQDNHYILVFEIRPEDFGSNYTLFYQEVQGDNKLKLRKIKMQMKDLTDYETTVTKKLNESLVVENLNGTKTEFAFKNYQIADELNYLYTSCYVWDCRVYEGKLKSSSFTGNRTLLSLNYKSTDTTQTGLSLSNYMVKNANITYVIDGVKKRTSFKLPLSRDWKGNYIYLLIPKEASNATDINVEFVSRGTLYQYKLKGGQTNES